jgi:hypothetical protein
MKQYMLTVQHEEQKVIYIPFMSSSDKKAKQEGERIYSEYKTHDTIIPVYPITGNFTGTKPPVKYWEVSKWVSDQNACNAWGRPCGGYWKTLK